MRVAAISGANLDYIQRVGFEPPSVDQTQVTCAPLPQRSMLHVTGIGRLSKHEKTSNQADDTLHSACSLPCWAMRWVTSALTLM